MNAEQSTGVVDQTTAAELQAERWKSGWIEAERRADEVHSGSEEGG